MKLKPCPFCGGEAELFCLDESIGWKVRCVDCCIETPDTGKERMVKYWNQRQPKEAR